MFTPSPEEGNLQDAIRARGDVAAALQSLAAFDFNRVRIGAQTAFWLNVFNAVVLRDAAELAKARKVRDVEVFFEEPRVRVAGFDYSLDDIEPGLLRGNAPKFGRSKPPMARDDPRLAHTPLAYDERIHFGLYCAVRSSPPLVVFGGGAVDRDLEQATEAYLRREVKVEPDGSVVTLPRQFLWYREDFGAEEGALGFALSRLDEATVQRVEARRGPARVRYADFDWSTP